MEIKRAAIGGSLALLLVAAAVAAIGRGSGDNGAPIITAPSSSAFVVTDADDGGAIVIRGAEMRGLRANGTIAWRLPMDKQDLLPFAVCLARCPAAEVTFGRSGSTPPEAPDSQRRTITAPGWRMSAALPRLRLDRPLLGGTTAPVRLTLGRVGEQPQLELAGGRSAGRLATTNVAPSLSADRRTGLLLELSSRPGATVFVRRGGSWALRARLSAGRGAQAACLSADGARLAVVGGAAPRWGAPRPNAKLVVLRAARSIESHAGMCAVQGQTLSVAVLRSAGDGSEALIYIHRRGHVRSARLVGMLPAGMWVSGRTQTTAVLQGDRLFMIDVAGHRRSIGDVYGAAQVSSQTLVLLGRSGRQRRLAF